jgi:hypothetical protein
MIMACRFRLRNGHGSLKNGRRIRIVIAMPCGNRFGSGNGGGVGFAARGDVAATAFEIAAATAVPGVCNAPSRFNRSATRHAISSIISEVTAG